MGYSPRSRENDPSNRRKPKITDKEIFERHEELTKLGIEATETLRLVKKYPTDT